MATILSWNVNGLRSMIAKGAMKALARRRVDVLCLQEVRAREDQVGTVLPRLRHQYFATTGRPGYAGTAVLSRAPAVSWADGMGHRVSDDEGRVVAAEFPTLYVVSVYVPNSQRGLPRLPFRLRWDRSYRSYVSALSVKKPVGPRLLTLEQRYRKPLLHSGKHTFRGCHFTPPASQNTSAIESAQPSTCQSKYI